MAPHRAASAAAPAYRPGNSGEPAAASRESGRIRLLALLGLAAAVLLPVGLCSSASVPEATLIASHPADGDRLAIAPALVTLTFSSALDPVQTRVQIIGPAGSPAAAGHPVVRGQTVGQTVEIDGEGPVVIVYHGVLRDGQEVTGELGFVVGAGAAGDLPVPDSPPVPERDYALDPLASLAILFIMVAGAGVLVVAAHTPARR